MGVLFGAVEVRSCNLSGFYCRRPQMSLAQAIFVGKPLSVVPTSAKTNSRRAAEKSCRTYACRLHAFLRPQGRSSPNEDDLLQAFRVCFLQGNYLGDVDRSKGVFGSHLLAALNYSSVCEGSKFSARAGAGGRPSVNAKRMQKTL